MGLLAPADAAFDPFDSYPPTRLPRIHVQRLMQHFLSAIAFQYYPLDLNMDSNPFVVAWWPRALADPALFHVSIQTASLDEELRAQRGFPVSELLMVDSVSLVRRKIDDSSLAVQDETMNAVVTLAAIEHGKGNLEVSRMHIDGVKRMVDVRGGIREVKRTSPLTARMVPWVSLLVMGAPQFLVQDDDGLGDGISPIPQWHLAPTAAGFDEYIFGDQAIDFDVADILKRLRHILQPSGPCRPTNADLHDLTCFVVHKLLLLPASSAAGPTRSATSECLRYATVLYMLVIHGTTYYAHIHLALNVLHQLRKQVEALGGTTSLHRLVGLWAVSAGMAVAAETDGSRWFMEQGRDLARASGLATWDDVLVQLRAVVWSEAHEPLFCRLWTSLLGTAK
ncbi:C6 zinc finger domain-containing protein [Purpureocillium lavendulum]|uniref:C6 zinc finger domain-containing protein n=1 Tax=Purpureocillium lavendulum TaxID=1247861 RepID=A0AB34FHL8_9HYPO|nr:C6 zinc finger domain-containing protein [Purpureocillium lavendulum]